MEGGIRVGPDGPWFARPLENTAKEYKEQGDVDSDEKVSTEEDSRRYLWARGLHMLCGTEGMEAKLLEGVHQTKSTTATD